MGLGELYQADTDRAIAAMIAAPQEPPAPPSKWNAWSAPLRAVPAAAADALAAGAETATAVVRATLAARDAPRWAGQTSAEREAADLQAVQGVSGRTALSDALRDAAEHYSPDPVTAGRAEQLVFGLTRGVGKALGYGLTMGPMGVAAFAGDEGLAEVDRLQRQGVDDATAHQAGVATTLATGAGALLPVAPLAKGYTAANVAKVAALGAVSGPAAFAAQQQMTRDILSRAGYDKIAEQSDPLDPWGLATAAVVPWIFGGLSLRGGSRTAGKAPPGRPEAPPRAAGAEGVGEAAARAEAPLVPREAVDAAMVHNLTLLRDRAGQIPPAARAAEVMRGPVTENPNFKAWFGDSKVVGEDGAPLVVYHGTTADFSAFDPEKRGASTSVSDAKKGFFFVDSGKAASEFTWANGEMTGSVMPVYLSMQNPFEVKLPGEWAPGKYDAAIDHAKRDGHDGVIIRGATTLGTKGDVFIAFHPEQIKSAIGNSGRFDPNSASLTDPVQARIDATPTEAATALETREVPVKSITLSEDVPQFKSGANAAGVVEPLGGSFDRTGVAPIQLWERTDGRLEVISGRHRLDLARRSGEETIPAQIHREADGFDVRRAAALDAELNIRDGQGKVRDYVDYFQATGLDRATAEQRGLLARSTGKRAYAIANDGSPELIAAHRAGAVGDEAAVAIAGAAPGDSRLQAVGIRAVQDGKTIAQAANTVRAVKLLAGERADDAAGDLFGFDDSAMREAESMAKIAAAVERAGAGAAGLLREAERLLTQAQTSTPELGARYRLMAQMLRERAAVADPDGLVRLVTDRVATVEASTPDLVVRHDENGQPVTVAEEMARVRREAAEGTDAELGALDADLLRVAAECALTRGTA